MRSKEHILSILQLQILRLKKKLMFTELRRKPNGARPPHGVDAAGLLPMGAQQLPDPVLAGLVRGHPRLHLAALLLLLRLPGLLLVGYLHPKLLPVLLGSAGASAVLEMSKCQSSKIVKVSIWVYLGHYNENIIGEVKLKFPLKSV